MKKILFVITACFLIGGLGLNSTHAGDTKKSYELTFTSEYMDKHPTVQKAFIPWTKDLEQQSKGRLKMRYFNPNTLAPAKDAYDSTVSGVIDIGAGFCGLNPGKFPLNEAMELPMIVPSAEAGSLVTWDLCLQFPEWRKEYEKSVLLWQWTSATYQFHTTKSLVRTLDDLKGLKIIGWSPKLLEIVRALGANALQIPPTDTYLALQRGMADGVLCPLAPVRSYKISDATKYHTIVDVNVGPFWAAMNKELFHSLPPDLQRLLRESTGAKMARESGKSLDQGAIEDSNWMKAQGHTFHVLTPEEKARWFEKIKTMPEEWIKKMQARGYHNAKQIVDTAMKLGKEYAKTTGKGYQE